MTFQKKKIKSESNNKNSANTNPTLKSSERGPELTD